MRWKSEWDRVLQERYADCSNAELAAELGCRVKLVLDHARRLGLRKSQDYRHKLYSNIAIRYDNAKHLNSASANEKRKRTRKRMVASERTRLSWGLEQKTRIHIRMEPREKLMQRNRLQRLGYIVDEANLVAYWTEETKRAVRLERLKRGVKHGNMLTYYDFAPLVANSDENA